jgi:hypothetical protein
VNGSHEAMVIPDTRYVKSGDVHIAYQVARDGPFDLVAALHSQTPPAIRAQVVA